jgi:hypothetical protein
MAVNVEMAKLSMALALPVDELRARSVHRFSRNDSETHQLAAVEVRSLNPD